MLKLGILKERSPAIWQGRRGMQPTKEFVSDFYRSGKWIIEIVTSDGEYGFWLGYENYGIMEYIFGTHMESMSPDEFLELVERNLYKEKVHFAYDHDEDVFEI